MLILYFEIFVFNYNFFNFIGVRSPFYEYSKRFYATVFTQCAKLKNTSLKNPKKIATFAALFFCISIWFSSFAFAQNIVTSALDDNTAGTLREIITNASAGSEITFDLPIGTNEIILSSEIDINKNLTIDGGSGVIISGDDETRIFYISNATVEMKNLTLENGNADFGSAVEVYGNNGTASFTAINCTFKNNSAGYGGAVDVDGNNGTASFTAINCTFKNNEAVWGGAVDMYTFNNNNATAYLFHCTFDGNTAYINGGDGIYIDGANTTLYAYNSIFTGSDNQIVATNGGVANLTNCLIQGENGLTRADVFTGDDLVCGGIVETAKVLKKGDIIHPDAANIITLLKTDQAGNKRRGFTATYGALRAVGCPKLPSKININVNGGGTLIIGK